MSENNANNGYFFDGRPLVNGASASGGSVQPGSGTVLEDSIATGNARTGILVEGGTGTIIKTSQVCAKITAIAVRYGATNAVLTGNEIRCAPRSALAIGPLAPGAVISGNLLSSPRIGMLIRNAGTVEVDNNHIIGATVFGITARGLSSQVRGVGNVLSGTGLRAVDARADARMPALYGTDTSGWVDHVKVTFWSYLQFHPLAALWLGILVLVLLAGGWSVRRRLPPHPYPVSTRWYGPAPYAEDALPVPDAGPAIIATAARHAAAGPERGGGPESALVGAFVGRAQAPPSEQSNAPLGQIDGPPAWFTASSRGRLDAPPAERFQMLAEGFRSRPAGQFEALPGEWYEARAGRFWQEPAVSRPGAAAGPPWEAMSAHEPRPGGSSAEESIDVTRPLPKVAD